jgi:arylsulfatase A-like enzyme
MQPANVPQDSESMYCWINYHQNRYKYRDQGIDGNLLRTFKAYYYAAISFVDYQVGRILESLESSGQLDNTLIVFSSDHGELLGDYNCFGKRSMHDGSSRIPMLLRYPQQFDSNALCATPVSLVDLFPTLAAAAGADVSQLELDGENMADIARGKSERKYVYSQFAKGEKAIYMIVAEKWKYIYSAGDRKEFLFDRINDPKENVNKAGTPLLSAIQAELKGALLDYLKKEGVEEAYLETGKSLNWKEYPKMDMSYLKNPDAELLIQDHESLQFEHEGYVPGRCLFDNLL